MTLQKACAPEGLIAEPSLETIYHIQDENLAMVMERKMDKRYYP